MVLFIVIIIIISGWTFEYSSEKKMYLVGKEITQSNKCKNNNYYKHNNNALTENEKSERSYRLEPRKYCLLNEHRRYSYCRRNQPHPRGSYTLGESELFRDD